MQPYLAHRRILAGLLASTVMSAPVTAFAQDTAAGEQPAATTAEQSEGNDIIVTAQKRAESLQDVPIAITALGTKTLDDLQVDQFEDYARLVPSLSFKGGGSGGTGPAHTPEPGVMTFAFAAVLSAGGVVVARRRSKR